VELLSKELSQFADAESYEEVAAEEDHLGELEFEHILVPNACEG